MSPDDPSVPSEPNIGDPAAERYQEATSETRADAISGQDSGPSSIDDPEIRPEVSSGGNGHTINGTHPINWKPFAIGGVIIAVVAVGAFSLLKSDSDTTTGPAATGPAATGPAATGPAATGPAATETANLVVTGADVSGQWTLDGGTDVSPTATLIAGVWTETTSDPTGAFGDLISLSMGGPIVEGTQTTSAEGMALGFSITRSDAQGNDIFAHVFSSRGGECQVTMARTSTGVSGTFTCTGIKDDDGHTANATGSFAT